jgi:hypothetical protein
MAREPMWQMHVPDANEELFHYTSLEGILGIGKSHSIWATDASFLTDQSELEHGRGLLRQAVERKQVGAEGSEREVLKQFAALVARGPMRESQVFVVSFTPNGNLLSQWRGYTPADFKAQCLSS